MRVTYARTSGIQHLFVAYELDEDELYGYAKPRKMCAGFLESALPYPSTSRIAIICDNFSTHLSMPKTPGSKPGQRQTPSRSPALKAVFPG